jgi:hypothetical protein
MNPTPSILRSGALIAQTGHVLALIAAYAWFQTHHAALPLSLLTWLLHCYIALRVAIDAALFDSLPGHEAQLDAWLLRFGLRRRLAPRSLDERIRASLRLWKLQLAACALQAILLASAWL